MDCKGDGFYTAFPWPVNGYGQDRQKVCNILREECGIYPEIFEFKKVLNIVNFMKRGI